MFLLRKFKHRCIILNVLLYGCEPRSPTFKNEHRLEVFENLALRKVLGPDRKEVLIKWRKQHTEQVYWFVAINEILFWRQYQGPVDGQDGADKTYGHSTENPQWTRYLEDLDVSGNMILKWILKQDGRAGNGLIWLWTQTGDGHVWTRQRANGLRETVHISRIL